LQLEVTKLFLTASRRRCIADERTKESGRWSLISRWHDGYVVYADGVIKYTGALALGGDHVSNDLGHGLKCR